MNNENEENIDSTPPDEAVSRDKKPVSAAKSEASRATIVQFNRSRQGKPAATHGVHTVIQSNGTEMPPVPYAEEIRSHVSALINGAVADLGGQDHVTAMQRQVLESSRVALTIVALGARYLSDQGILNKKGNPHALLSVLGTYLNIVRLNAVELGLQRQARPAGASTLAEYLEIRSRETTEPTVPAESDESAAQQTESPVTEQ